MHLDQLVARFCDLFQNALLEYGREQNPDLGSDDFGVLLSDTFYVGNDCSDPPKYLAKAIISEIQLTSSDSDEVGQRAYELYTNVKREHNSHILRAIITGSLPTAELASMNPKDLAPDHMKKRRRIEEERYLNEEVIIRADSASSVSESRDHENSTCQKSERSTNSNHIQSNEDDILIGLEDYYASVINMLTEEELEQYKLLPELSQNYEIEDLMKCVTTYLK